MNVINLLGAANKLAGLMDQPTITVNAKRCVHAKNKANNCDTCVKGCPVGAIALEDHQVAVDTALCVQCGLCLHTCPTGAFEGVDGVEKLLDCVKPLPPGRVIEIACPHHPQADTRLTQSQTKIIATRCLAAYGVSTYASLMASGVKKVILRLDACAECPIGQVREPILDTVAYANGLLADGEHVVVPVTQVSADDLRVRPAQHSANKSMSRRELFQIFRKPVAEPSPTSVVTPETADRYIDSFDERIPQERVRLLRALRQLEDTAVNNASTPFTGLKAGTDCTACGVCGFACPTGALRIEWGDKTFALTLAAGACTECSLCVELCPVKTLAFDEPIAVEQALTLERETIVSGALKHCRRCKAPFASSDEDELCPLCEYRRRFPFGSTVS